MDNFWNNIELKLNRLSHVIALIGLFGLLVLSLITVGEVILRSLFDYPILGVNDASGLIITLAIASCFPLVSADRGHISVKVLGMKLGPQANALLEAFGSLVVTGFFILLVQQLWLYAQELSDAQQTTWMLLWPVGPWWKAATLLISLCIINQLVCFMTSLRSFFMLRR